MVSEEIQGEGRCFEAKFLAGEIIKALFTINLWSRGFFLGRGTAGWSLLPLLLLLPFPPTATKLTR